MSPKDSQIEQIKDAKKSGEFEKAVDLIDAMKKAGTLTPNEVKSLKSQVRNAKSKAKADAAKVEEVKETKEEKPEEKPVSVEELVSQGKYNEARELLKSLELDPEDEEKHLAVIDKAEKDKPVEIPEGTEEMVKEISDLVEEGKHEEALEKANELPEDSEGLKMAKESIIKIINDAIQAEKEKEEEEKEHMKVPAETVAAVDHAVKNNFYEKLPRLIAYLPDDHPYKAEVLEEHRKMYDVVRDKTAKKQKKEEKEKANQKHITPDELHIAYMELFNLFNRYENQQQTNGRAFRHVTAAKNRLKIHMSAFKRSC